MLPPRALVGAAALVLGGAGLAACGAGSPPPAAQTTTALGTTLAWVGAVNAHDLKAAQRYFAPSARPSTAWVGTTRVRGTIFSDVKCVPEPGTESSYAALYCTAREPAAFSGRNPEQHFSVELHRRAGHWVIVEYDPG